MYSFHFKTNEFILSWKFLSDELQSEREAENIFIEYHQVEKISFGCRFSKRKSTNTSTRYDCSSCRSIISKRTRSKADEKIGLSFQRKTPSYFYMKKMKIEWKEPQHQETCELQSYSICSVYRFSMKQPHEVVNRKRSLQDAPLEPPLKIKNKMTNVSSSIAMVPKLVVKPRLHESSKFSITKKELKISIVDARKRDLKISLRLFSSIEYALQKAMWKKINEGQPIFFGSSVESYRGFRVIYCESEETLQFVKDAVTNMRRLWPDTNLQVRQLHDLPTSLLIKINLPIPGMEDVKMVFGILIANNTDIPVKHWKLTAYGNSFYDRIPVLFWVDEVTIDILEQKNYKMTFCLRSVLVNMERPDSYKNSVEGIFTIEDIVNNDIDISGLFHAKLKLAEEPVEHNDDESRH